jgi:AraC-like DNA-binding protein
MASNPDLSHHIKGLPPALKALQAMGFNAEECLAGTGLSTADLENPQADAGFSLDQEFRFHRNLLALTGDPLLGLTLGQAYTLENYGLLGYAFLSAPTLRHALTIMRNYGLLSFTLFTIDFEVTGSAAILSFSRYQEIPEDLFAFYVDRDMTAATLGGHLGLQEPLPIREVRLMHDGGGREQRYRQHFPYSLTFSSPRSELHFEPALLDKPMPLRDPETSDMCQQQCQMLLARMSHSSGFAEKVRQLIVARPGFFPDIDYVAEKLYMTSRTLRRRLSEENSSYQQILGEVRYQLAREYLSTSTLPLEEISVLLGYSAPGNFTHAFKRWHGSSPRQFRQENQ